MVFANRKHMLARRHYEFRPHWMKQQRSGWSLCLQQNTCHQMKLLLKIQMMNLQEVIAVNTQTIQWQRKKLLKHSLPSRSWEMQEIVDPWIGKWIGGVHPEEEQCVLKWWREGFQLGLSQIIFLNGQESCLTMTVNDLGLVLYVQTKWT